MKKKKIVRCLAKKDEGTPSWQGRQPLDPPCNEESPRSTPNPQPPSSPPGIFILKFLYFHICKIFMLKSFIFHGYCLHGQLQILGHHPPRLVLDFKFYIFICVSFIFSYLKVLYFHARKFFISMLESFIYCYIFSWLLSPQSTPGPPPYPPGVWFHTLYIFIFESFKLLTSFVIGNLRCNHTYHMTFLKPPFNSSGTFHLVFSKPSVWLSLFRRIP